MIVNDLKTVFEIKQRHKASNKRAKSTMLTREYR